MSQTSCCEYPVNSCFVQFFILLQQYVFVRCPKLASCAAHPVSLVRLLISLKGRRRQATGRCLGLRTVQRRAWGKAGGRAGEKGVEGHMLVGSGLGSSLCAPSIILSHHQACLALHSGHNQHDVDEWLHCRAEQKMLPRVEQAPTPLWETCLQESIQSLSSRLGAILCGI